MDDRDHLSRPALELARHDMPLLAADLDVAGALEELRKIELGERVVYLYVVDREQHLVGVLPVRRLLHGQPHEVIQDLASGRVVSLPASATVLEACELLVMHRFLAIPIVDAEGRVAGVVDVTLLSDEVFDLAERQEVDDLFETIGFRVSQVRDASPGMSFRVRFPWLLATIVGGSACAVLAGVFEVTLQQFAILAFFLTLVLGLGEAVTAQALAMTIPVLRHHQPTWRWYLRAFRHEAATAALLGVSCGGLVAVIAYLWHGNPLAAFSIGGSLFLSLLVASLLGLSVPAILHRTHLDPSIAAGPVALALADVVTVATYLGLATLLMASRSSAP
ncbi:MAG TPA: magnesium transporter [Thermoanaerobaculaceae bacterium]|nr:magnesium transporter [Thermoanaerobaculaceae bacterium]HPS78010.1 magnesium transporter [Thermoanaerobaculaceae bacterium]